MASPSKLRPLRRFRRILLKPKVIMLIRERAQARMTQALGPGIHIGEVRHSLGTTFIVWFDHFPILLEYPAKTTGSWSGALGASRACIQTPAARQCGCPRVRGPPTVPDNGVVLDMGWDSFPRVPTAHPI